MQIMLFGGAFDPPHNGHKKIAETIMRKELADELWFVPCFQHPFEKDMAPAEDRFKMLQLIKVDRTRVCRYEIDHPVVSYSFDTLQNFSSNEPRDKFSWLIGSDALPTFHKWKNYEQLLQRYAVYVYPRKGFPLASTYPRMKLLHDVEEINVSSSEVRDLLRHGKPVDHRITPRVENYIRGYSLYNVKDEK